MKSEEKNMRYRETGKENNINGSENLEFQQQIKQNFPQMPRDMRAMVEQEVNEQMKEKNVKRRFLPKKAAVVVLVATMAFGTTVFAGIKLYQMYTNKVGDYAVETRIKNSSDMGETGTGENMNIPDVKMEVTYLPEGMAKGDDEWGKYYYEDNYMGGVSIYLYKMDLGDDAFRVTDTDVITSEEIKVSGHDGIYLEKQTLAGEMISNNQKIYVSYTEEHYVMEMLVSSDVTKEEALKIAEGIRLLPVDNASEEAYYTTWSEHLKYIEDENNYNYNVDAKRDKATIEEMKNTHAIGEEFALLPDYLSDHEPQLRVKVTDVKVTENVKSLGDDVLCKQLGDALDADGNLKKTTLNYIKSGDGVNDLDKTVKTVQAGRKVVYVTMDYTNCGETDATNVLHSLELLGIKEQDGSYYNYSMKFNGASSDPHGEWDWIQDTSGVSRGTSIYYDVQDEGEKNYITSLNAGETKTVHYAFVILDGEEPYLYLNADQQGGIYEFTDRQLQTGLVDIRQ